MCKYQHFRKDLKTAFAQAIERLGGNRKASDLIRPIFGRGCGQSQISNYCDQNHALTPPAHVMFAVDSLCGHPFCTEVLASHLGLSVHALSATPAEVGDVMQRIARKTETSGDLGSFTLRAFHDGALCENEKRGIRQRIASEREALHAIEEVTA